MHSFELKLCGHPPYAKPTRWQFTRIFLSWGRPVSFHLTPCVRERFEKCLVAKCEVFQFAQCGSVGLVLRYPVVETIFHLVLRVTGNATMPLTSCSGRLGRTLCRGRNLLSLNPA